MRWVPADSQLGPELCRDLGVTLDPAAVPRDQFVVAGTPGSDAATAISPESWTGSHCTRTNNSACRRTSAISSGTK
jgi:hypothetical protein